MKTTQADWTVLRSFVESLQAARHPRLVLERLLEGLATLTGARRGIVLLRRDDRSELLPVAVHGPRTLGEMVAASRTVCALALDGTKPVVVADSFADPRLRGVASAMVSREPLTILCAPIPDDGGQTGVVYLDMPRCTPFPDESWPDLLATTAALAGTLVAADRTRERLVADRERRAVLDSLEGDAERVLEGTSPAAREAAELIRAVAPQDVSVLVTGETGTGKDMVARTIHRLSPRRGGPFVAVNCAALPRDLIEAELFGVEAGAFTGAVERRPGRFELADSGTLFLDEVGDLPLDTQATLLRVLQDRTVTPLGGGEPRRVDFRLVCATNVDLEEAVSRNLFRQDLLYRIDVMRISLTALRHRTEDVLPLALRFLTDYALRYGRRLRDFMPEARALLLAHDWPGNVRELRNAIERAVVVEKGDVVSAASLPLAAARGDGADGFLAALPEDYEAARLVFEKAFLQRSLDIHGGNLTAVSRASGLPRSTIYRRLTKYGVAVPGGEGADEP